MSDDDIRRKTTEEVTEHIVELLQALFTATKTVHIYPLENPAVQRAVDAAYDVLIDQIPVGGALDLSYLEDRLVVNGEVLPEYMQKRGIIHSFHQLMKDRRISSITFWHGLDREELRKFLMILGTKAPSVGLSETHELDEILVEEGIRRIEIDEQIYVPISKREKVVDARAAVEREEDMALKVLKDEVFAKFLVGEISFGDVDAASVNAILADPERMMEIVRSVLASKGWGEDIRTLPYRVDETRSILERMSAIIDQVDDPLIRSKLTKEVSKITSQIDAPDIADILLSATGLDSIPSRMPKVVIPLLGDQKLAAVVESVVGEYQRLEEKAESDEWPSRRATLLRSILVEARAAADGELAARIEGMIHEDSTRDAMYEDKAATLGLRLADTLERTGNLSLCDIAVGPVLVVAAKHLFDRDQDELGSVVLKKLSEKFRRQSPDARSVAAQQLWRLFQHMKNIGKERHLGDFYEEVREAIDSEFGALKTLTAVSSKLEAATDAGGQVEAISDILDVDQKIVVSAKSIEKLMSTDTGKVVHAVFTSGDKAAQEAITRVLLEMEDRGIPALVETARAAVDDETIESVAESLLQMETDSLPYIAAYFTEEIDTFETINLIKLVAMIGDENSVSVFNPLMLSEDIDVRLAVITALGILGGKHALQMLLAESMNVDLAIRSAAVKELRNFRDYFAVRRLMEIVEPKGKGEFEEDEYVMMAACKSLGELKVRGAVEALSAIARGGRGKYSEELRACAVTSLGMIGTEQASKTLKELLKDRSLLVRSTARKALAGHTS